MDAHTIYTRVHSGRSAGRLLSAKASSGYSPFKMSLLEEFQRHANMGNREPTGLVSVSTRIVDTLKRAFEKRVEDGESSEQIWIVFIAAPSDAAVRVHSATKLAEQCELPIKRFKYEVVFEWAIPEDLVLYEVSLEYLIQRDLPEKWFSHSSTEEARDYIASELQGNSRFMIGLDLGFFARAFGARAPLEWIAHQLFYDCMGNSQRSQDLDDGIDTSLYEMWLADIDFVRECQRFRIWQDAMEEIMLQALMDLWSIRHGAAGDPEYREARERLDAEYEEKRRMIEVEARRIGL